MPEPYEEEPVEEFEGPEEEPVEEEAPASAPSSAPAPAQADMSAEVLQSLAAALHQLAENQKRLYEEIETLKKAMVEQQGQNLVELLKVVAMQNQSQPSIIERLAMQSFLENLTTSLAFNKLIQRAIAKKYADVFKEVEAELSEIFSGGNEGAAQSEEGGG